MSGATPSRHLLGREIVKDRACVLESASPQAGGSMKADEQEGVGDSPGCKPH